MAKVFVAELAEEQEVTSFFMVRGRQLRSFRDRAGGFLILRLGDKSGEIDGKVWDDADRWYRELKTDTVVKVAGHAQLYQGRLELVVSRVRAARDDEYALEDFLPASERDRAEMVSELESALASVGNPHLALLLASVFDTATRREFEIAPAAKVIHHACLGGLLQHTLEVIRLCRAALELYPAADRDLVITGALLHDIGKIREYMYHRRIDFSDEGRLLGHIVIGEEIVVEHARQIEGFPDDLLMRLRHMVLSHHGQYEWQSPKRPKTMEACILHLADYFSGQVAMFDTSIKANMDPEATWTDYNRYLDRPVFLGSKTPLSPPVDESGTLRRLLEERFQGY